MFVPIFIYIRYIVDLLQRLQRYIYLTFVIQYLCLYLATMFRLIIGSISSNAGNNVMVNNDAKSYVYYKLALEKLLMPLNYHTLLRIRLYTL